MIRIVASRLAGMLFAILGASFLAFVLLRVVPGNPARLILGPLAPVSSVRQLSHDMGLDQSLPQQYWRYLKSFVTGDWGFSYSAGAPVRTVIGQRFPATIELDLYAFMLGTWAALVLALVATYRRRPGVDRLVRGLSYLGLGTPPFWLGLVLLIVLTQHWHLLPGPEGRLPSTATPPPQVTGLYTVDALLDGDLHTFWEAVKHLILPVITLATLIFAVLVRLLRANLLEVEREPFLVVVKSKGVPRWTAFTRHALPNAVLPAMTLAGLVLAELLTGSVLVERVFDWPGVGGLVVDSISRKDYAVVQTFILLSACFYVVINAAVDVAYAIVDPRTRLPGAGELVSDGAPILQVRDLQAAFRSGGRTVRAVRGVDLDLRAGERLGLVGESGCGKSALALAVAGLLEPPGSVDGGSIVLGGRDLAALPERHRRRTRGSEIAVVFQDALSGLDPVKPIGRQISEGLRVHDTGLGRSAARRRAVELLQEVGIAHAERRVDEYPHQFSGGMRQRVMIAIAIANEPSVLIADEPTTALDVTTQAQILRVLQRMTQQRGCAVIFITHDLGIVAGFCDTVCVMYAGRIVERSATTALFAHPVHPYTEALLAAVPRRDASGTRRLREIGGAPPDLSAPIAGCSFRPRCTLGRDREDCLRLSPPLVAVELEGARIEAECHLAEARADQIGEAVGR